MRNPINQTVNVADNEPVPVLGRGYTGHEHLAIYGLINMNARLYDSVLGRFLSADPYIQEMYNSQNFNRYSYCLNNPLKFSDESGELFGFVGGLFKGTFNFFKGFGKWAFAGGSFKRDVIQATVNPVWNGLKIDAGMFIGSPMQIISRWTWELPQSLVGNAWSSARNVAGYVDQVKYYKGATFIIHDNSSHHRGITFGSYINMDIEDTYTKAKYQPEWNGGKFTPAADNMMMHEYGHYLQSQMIGVFYLPVIGLPSLANEMTKDYSSFYTEKWANNLAYDFFISPRDHGNTDWNFNKYPVSNSVKEFPWILRSATGNTSNSSSLKPRKRTSAGTTMSSFKY